MIHVRPYMPFEQWGFPDGWGDDDELILGVPFQYHLVRPEDDL